MEKIIGFTVDGLDAGTSEMFIVDGRVDTSAVEDYFYKVLRRESKDPIEEETTFIIDNLTNAEEGKLQEAHMAQYHGTDDDSPDDYENWLSELSLEEIKKIIYGR